MAYIEIWSPNKYAGAGGYKKSIIVVHTNEAGPYAYQKFPGDARSLGKYLSQSHVQASYHKCVDRNGDVCRMLVDVDRAWAAGNVGNNEGLHLCVLGWAAQSREEWLSFPQQLDQVGREIAIWCKQEGIPADKLNAAQLKDGTWGVAGHGDVAQAWRETDHTDPGPNFPYDYVLNVAKRELGQSEGDISVADGAFLVDQMMGADGRKGWKELAPQRNPEGKRFSIFKYLRGEEPNVERQTVVEAIATLVFEATLRILPYRKNNVPKTPETVLGHAAAAHGVSLDNRSLLLALAEAQIDLCKKVNAEPYAPLVAIVREYRGYEQPAETAKLSPLDPAWTPPEQG